MQCLPGLPSSCPWPTQANSRQKKTGGTTGEHLTALGVRHGGWTSCRAYGTIAWPSFTGTASSGANTGIHLKNSLAWAQDSQVPVRSSVSLEGSQSCWKHITFLPLILLQRKTDRTAPGITLPSLGESPKICSRQGIVPWMAWTG